MATRNILAGKPTAAKVSEVLDDHLQRHDEVLDPMLSDHDKVLKGKDGLETTVELFKQKIVTIETDISTIKKLETGIFLAILTAFIAILVK